MLLNTNVSGLKGSAPRKLQLPFHLQRPVCLIFQLISILTLLKPALPVCPRLQFIPIFLKGSFSLTCIIVQHRRWFKQLLIWYRYDLAGVETWSDVFPMAALLFLLRCNIYSRTTNHLLYYCSETPFDWHIMSRCRVRPELLICLRDQGAGTLCAGPLPENGITRGVTWAVGELVFYWKPISEASCVLFWITLEGSSMDMAKEGNIKLRFESCSEQSSPFSHCS